MPKCDVEIYIATRDADGNELMRKNLRSKTGMGVFCWTFICITRGYLIDRKSKIVQFCFYALTYFVSIPYYVV